MKVKKKERIVGISFFFKPVQGHVGDDVSDIAFYTDGALVFGDEVWVVIRALTGQNFVLVKAFGGIAKVELAKHGRLVASLLKELGKGDVGGIEGEIVVDFTVEVGVLAGEDGGTAWRTDGVGHRGIGKAHAHLGYAVNVGGLYQSIAVGRDGLVGMVIRHDKDDVGSLGVGSLG